MLLQPFVLETPRSSRPKPSIDAMLKVRGAMWSVRWNGPYGPRPGDPTNILAMDYGQWYSLDDQKRMIDLYAEEGYTHYVTGPAVDVDGYHGCYPTQPNVPTMTQWQKYLDWITLCQTRANLIGIHFQHPDGWTLEQMDALESLYRDARAQALLPLKVPTGWEPTKYDWKASYWRSIIEKCQGWDGANAPTNVYLIHTVTDTDAPTGDGDDFPNGNAGAWEIVCPVIDGWLVQNGPYDSAPHVDPTLTANFMQQWDMSDPRSLVARFRDGAEGWPTYSRRGNTPIKVYNGECTAYESFWANLPYDQSRPWGDLALSMGVDGALDGCSMK